MVKRYRTYRDFEYELIARWFRYDAETGELFRRLESGEWRECTTWFEESDGKLRPKNLLFNGYWLQSTHIMFMLRERRWPHPGMQIDHRDGVVPNMRWTNLREANRNQQMMNKPSPGKWKDPDLEVGVDRLGPNSDVFRVRVTIDGVQRHIGCYPKGEANRIAREMRLAHQGEYSVEASRGEDPETKKAGE